MSPNIDDSKVKVTVKTIATPEFISLIGKSGCVEIVPESKFRKEHVIFISPNGWWTSLPLEDVIEQIYKLAELKRNDEE